MGAPLNYLQTAGPRADPATALTWGLLDISVAVVVIVTVLVVLGVALRRAPGGEAGTALSPQGSGLNWIVVGVILTLAALAVSLVWTVMVVAKIDSPATTPALTVRVEARQWWWRADYPAAGPADPAFSTANEIHIPVGRPVLFELTSPDVIHSFWVPALTGKTDTIPGRQNLSWMQADRPGRYAGQCTEYCGVQHAKMGLAVIAQPQADFDAWRAAQGTPAASPTDAEAVRGEAVFASHCASCHIIRGGPGHGQAGPDLTHLMSRGALAGETVANTPGGLAGWVSNPQGIKPGAHMPASQLSGPDLNAVVAYLETLK